MTTPEFWALTIAVGIVCGGLAAVIANAKHRDGRAWFLVGFAFSILGLLAIIGMPALPEREAELPRPAAPLSAGDKVGLIVAAALAVLFVVALAAWG